MNHVKVGSPAGLVSVLPTRWESVWDLMPSELDTKCTRMHRRGDLHGSR